MASKYWLKLYHEMLDDPKVARLNDSAYRRFIECLLMAGELDEGGFLPPLEDMAWRIRVSETALTDDMTHLALGGMVHLKEHEGGPDRWYLSKFTKRQSAVPPDERKRQQREREKRAQYYDVTKDVTGNVTKDVTIRDTDTDTDTDTEEIQKRKDKKRAPAPITIPESLNTPEFVSAFDDFTEHRKEIKAKMTPRAANMQLKKLSDFTPGIAVAMLEQSIANGWKGIFDLKQSNNSHGPTNAEIKQQQNLSAVDRVFDDIEARGTV